MNIYSPPKKPNKLLQCLNMGRISFNYRVNKFKLILIKIKTCKKIFFKDTHLGTGIICNHFAI